MAVTIEEQVIIDLSVDIRGMTAELRAARSAAQNASKDMRARFEATKRSIERTTSAVSTLAATVVGVYGIQSAKAIARTADTWNLLEGRIRLVSRSYDELITKREELFKISQDSRVGYEQTADLYARIARNTARMNITDQSRLNVTDAISKSLIISGASAQSANAALVQLGQGLAAEALRGQELNSVMEQTPRLSEAIADGMGVSIGSLRALAEQGKITSEVLITAIESQQDAITEEFLQMPITMAQGMIVLDNEWMKFVGTLDDALGITELVVEQIYGMVKGFHDAGDAYSSSGGGMIDTLMSVMAYTDMWADHFVLGLVLIYTGWDDLRAYAAYSIVALGEAVDNTISQVLAGVNLLLEKAKLEVMTWVQWLTSLKIGDSVIFEGPISKNMLQKSADSVKAYTAELEALGNTTSVVSAKAEESFKKTVAANKLLVEAAMKKAEITTATRKSDLEWAAAVREFEKDFTKDNKPPPVTALPDTKALKSAAAAAAKSQREANKLIKDAIDLRNTEAQILMVINQIEFARTGNILDQHQAITAQIELAEMQRTVAEEAWQYAEQQAKLLTGAAGGDKARKKAAEAQLKYLKEDLKVTKLLTIEASKFAEEMYGVGDNLSNNLLSGDYQAIFGDLAKDIINVFVDPLKDSFNTLFGNTMQDMIGDFYTSMTASVSDFAASAITDQAAMGNATAATGVATQAGGDPYTAFARMAAMAAVMAGLGFIVSGGSGSSGVSPEEWQEENNVVDTPESDSVVNLLESMDWSLTRELTYSKGIYDNLAALVTQSGKAAVSLTSGFSFANMDAFTEGGFAGFSSKDVSTLFSGMNLQFKGLEDILAQTETVIQTTKSSWWGLKEKTRTSTTRASVDDGTQQAIANAYISGIDALMGATAALGVVGAETVLDSFTGTLHKLNLEGKSQDEVAAMISGAISSDLDALTLAIVPWIADFQRAGEAYLETMGRVVYEIEVTDYMFNQLGSTMTVVGQDAAILSEAFILASGGLDKALANVSGYIDNFFSDAEKQALRVEQLSGVGLFENEEDYKNYVEGLTALSAAGNIDAAEKLAQAVSLQDVYREYFNEILRLQDEATAEAEKLADEAAEAKDKAAAAAKDILDARIAAAQDEVAFHEGILAQLSTAYTGALNYMNSLELSNTLGNMALDQLAAGDSQGYFDTLYKQLAEDKKMAITREDYAAKFDSYTSELRGAEYKPKTIDDAVDTLEQILEQNRKLEAAIAKGAYQAPLVTSYEGGY